MQKGYIDISKLSSPPEKAEFETAKYFADLGKDITFIRPSSIPKQHRPDILMDGVEWEIKCPEGNSTRTIENNIRKALKQSHNIIVDLRHIKMSEKHCLSQLFIQFQKRPQLRKLYIIKKNGELIKIPEL
jgi:hypothetical protein